MVVTHGAPGSAVRPAVGLAASPSGTALTIGNFDGVHRGHRALLDRISRKAKELELASCVLTFEPHPREFFAAKAGVPAPTRLTRLRDKLELMAGAGVDRVHVARFDEKFAALSAAEFVELILVRGLRTRWLAVGRDFKFGKGRGGDAAFLEAAATRAGFGLELIGDVAIEGERVSSSAVREALEAGELRRAERLLGHTYTISGRVAHGRKLGRDLGFPTANIVLRRPPPLSGIHVVEVEGYGPGVASIGTRPTVNPVARPLLEVHLLDWSGELYGKHLRVCFLEKLRDEEKYEDLERLKQAIARDARKAREYFARHG
jgi:riboflavin kinase/FMN adenylyltransferase